MSTMNAVTPPQAREHWCPFTRVYTFDENAMGGQSQSGVNRTATGPRKGANCIAHKCMAWRWAQTVILRSRAVPDAGEAEPPRPEGVPETWRWAPPDPEDFTPGMWVEPEKEAAERALGYCALAGDPAQQQAMAGLTEAVGRLEHATLMQARAIAGRHA